MTDSQKGGLFALAAFSLWSTFPLYFKTIVHINPIEILANRVIWAVAALSLLLTLLRYWHRLQPIFTNKKNCFYLLLTTMLIGFNWGTYIWSGVSIEIIMLGNTPWIALILAFSFSLYGFIHKRIHVDAISGLFIETLLLLPLALILLLYLHNQQLGPGTWSYSDWLLLIGAGPVTIIPLLFFTAAAKRIDYSTIGFFQYITPSLLFLLATFLYKEPFTLAKLLTFTLIWLALALLSIDAVRQHYTQNLKSDGYIKLNQDEINKRKL